MKKITTEDLLKARAEMDKTPAVYEAAVLEFAGDQPDLLEYIANLDEEEDGDGATEEELEFLERIAVNLWGALKAGGFVAPPAGRQAILALEKRSYVTIDKYFVEQGAKGGVERLMASLASHPQPELARATLLLTLSISDKGGKVDLDLSYVLAPVMTIIDALCGVEPAAAELAEFVNLPHPHWSGIEDLRLVEQSSDYIGRLTAGKEFATEDELNAFLEKRCAGGPLKAPASNKLEEAQDLIYRAMDYRDYRVRESLARRALALSPDCADAWNLLAEETAETAEEALELCRKGITAGERALGPALAVGRGQLWGNVKARPYLRARKGEAMALEALGRLAEAERAYCELLELNAGDNQGVRYLLLSFYAARRDFARADALINDGRFPDDGAAEWLYAKALAAYALGKPEASLCLERALAANPHVPDFLLTGKKPPECDPEFTTRGGEDEAFRCAELYRQAWEATPGALPWLKAGQKALAKPKPGRNEACPCGSGKKYKKCCGR